jgi:hypothetical protein
MSEPLPVIGEGPRFVPRLKSDRGGVDYLGLRQVNLDLTADCIPGINNVTSYIRPFAILSWIHWKFHALHVAQKKAEASEDDLHRFQDKVEVLFTWGHQLGGLRGVPGLDSRCPPATGRGVELSFAAWGGRKRHNTSLQAPVQYGPALKTGDGLGLAEPVARGLLRVTTAGESLARALDRRLTTSPSYGLLEKLDATHGSEADARDLFRLWRVNAPTLEERRAFLPLLYNPEEREGATAFGLRSAMIYAILHLLRQARRPLTEEQIRCALAWTILPGGRSLEYRGNVYSLLLRWRVLQIRQAQRSGLEALLAWLENRLLQERARTLPISALRSEWAKALASEQLSDGGTRTCADTLGAFRRGTDSEEGYRLSCARGQTDLDLFPLTDQVLTLGRDQPDRVLPLAVKTLVAVANWTEWLEVNRDLHSDLGHGGIDRISLTHFSAGFRRFADRPVGEWLTDIMERYVISQHMRVATYRFDGRAQRLRFALGENGLEFYDEKPTVPQWTQDHLATLLSLLSDCGLISEDGGLFQYEQDSL